MQGRITSATPANQSGATDITLGGTEYTVHAYTSGTNTFNTMGGGSIDVFMIGGGGATGDEQYHNGGKPYFSREFCDLSCVKEKKVHEC